MASVKNKTHLVYWISLGFLLSFILSLCGAFFPFESVLQTLFFKLDGLCAVCAFACFAAKAATEGFDIASAGFTMLAISQGLFLAQIDEPKHWHFESAITAVFFLVPAFIMVAYYGKFPKWLHVAGIISTIPFITLTSVYYLKSYMPAPVLMNIVYLIYQFITLCWAYYTWKERNK